MKRSPLPTRRAPLARSSWGRRPARRTSDETHARQLVRQRSDGTCEGCGLRPASEWSHRVSRAHSGPWSASNGLYLCGPGGCHAAAHASPLWARERGWILRSTDNPLTVPAWHARHGWVLLDDAGGFAPVAEVAA